MYSIELSPDAVRFLERLLRARKDIYLRIARSIDSLKTAPFSGKKLSGQLDGIRSLRVGEYRILYTIIEKRILVQVLKIAHRKEVYR
jgi:mRNA interferase RelE/StbE